MGKEIFTKKLRNAMLTGESLNENGKLWTRENFENLKKVTIDNTDESKTTFLPKINGQLQNEKVLKGFSQEEKDALHPLMVEMLTLYYFVPTNIKLSTKKKALKDLIDLDTESKGKFSFDFCIDAINFKGIASGGMGYNTNKFTEAFYPIKVFTQWFELDEKKRSDLLLDDNFEKFQEFLDGTVDGNPQYRHALLHLLFPNHYEPIISNSEKAKLVSAFEGLIENIEKVKSMDIDQKIRQIKLRLKKLLDPEVHFYRDDVIKFWSEDTSSDGESVTSLLEYKKQIVLFGPPGTSKTYRAKKIAKNIIHYRLAKELGSSLFEIYGQKKLDKAIKNNIHRLQLHPAFSYEDFVRGMHFQDGNTVYKPGYLLTLIEKMKDDPELPHVLILDEINRVDLSRLFGECFSALENRGESIDLIGSAGAEPVKLSIPNNLYIIGTMNLIDHSVEQLDFALRRRFLWIEATYNPAALYDICVNNWRKINKTNLVKNSNKVELEFERLVEAADNLNKKIAGKDEELGKNEELGKDFILGHVFFLDSVVFLHEALQVKPTKRKLLFTDKGEWCDPIEKLWNYSLQPLLKEYLSGIDTKSREDILKALKSAFKPNED